MSMTQKRQAELRAEHNEDKVWRDGWWFPSAVVTECLDALDEAEDRLSATIAGQRVIDRRLRDEKNAAEAKLAEAKRERDALRSRVKELKDKNRELRYRIENA